MKQVEQGDPLVEQIVVTIHLTQKMPSYPKMRINCSSLEEGSSNGGSGSKRAIEAARKWQRQRWPEKGKGGRGLRKAVVAAQ